MQLSQLEYLQGIAECGGVCKAARAAHVSPQAVSSAIRKLESEFGVTLLDRSSNEAGLTEAGREFARRGQMILAQVGDLKSLSTQSARGISPDGHFRLYVPNLHQRGALFDEDWYESFSIENPDIHLDVWHQPTATCFESLLLGISDAAVSFEEPHDHTLASKCIGEKPLRVLARTDGCRGKAAFSVRNLLSGKIAVPINLGPCLNALSLCPEAQLVSFKFRDVGYGAEEQLAFLRKGGFILTLLDSPLVSAGSDIGEYPIEGPQDISLPVYFCCRKNTWSDRHQSVYWHLLRRVMDR